MAVVAQTTKKKKNATTTTALLLWGSIGMSIVVCLWNNSISMTRISSSKEHDEWHNQPILATDNTNKLPTTTMPPSPRLQLWYFPHMGHPWLEWMAAQHNLTWGACFFDESPLYAPWCPSFEYSNWIHPPPRQGPPPPLPPHSQVLAWTWKHPDNPLPEPLIRPLSKSRPINVVVLRNPYHRLIDLYYYLIERWDVTKPFGGIINNTGNVLFNVTRWEGPCRTPLRHMDAEYYTPVQLNSFLIKWLKHLRSTPCFQDCLLLPQYEYTHIFHKKQNKTARLVDYLLHYEHLPHEWNVLARQHPTLVPPTMIEPQPSTFCQHRDNNQRNQSRFTEYDLSPTTLALIHRIYAMDFTLGNYTQIPIKPYVWPTSKKPYHPQHHVVIDINHTNNSNNRSIPLSPRLELIHIPKTGGTMLELWAARYNVTWGACHFEVPWKWRKGSDLRHCPRDVVRDTRFYTDFPLWHAPRYMLPHHLPFDPYDNLKEPPSPQQQLRPPHYFVVIRNPYQRLISLFYMNYATFARGNITKCMDSPYRLNVWLRQWFRLMLVTGPSSKVQAVSINPTTEPYDPDRVCHHACAFLPQAHYILPPHLLPPLSLQYRPRDIKQMLTNLSAALFNRSSWSIHHMLHLEHLEQELEALLKKQYPDYHRLLFESEPGTGRTKVVVNANKCKTTLTPKDLERETVMQIHSLYALDFVLGGYTMMPMNSIGG